MQSNKHKAKMRVLSILNTEEKTYTNYEVETNLSANSYVEKHIRPDHNYLAFYIRDVGSHKRPYLKPEDVKGVVNKITSAEPYLYGIKRQEGNQEQEGPVRSSDWFNVYMCSNRMQFDEVVKMHDPVLDSQNLILTKGIDYIFPMCVVCEECDSGYGFTTIPMNNKEFRLSLDLDKRLTNAGIERNIERIETVITHADELICTNFIDVNGGVIKHTTTSSTSPIVTYTTMRVDEKIYKNILFTHMGWTIKLDEFSKSINIIYDGNNTTFEAHEKPNMVHSVATTICRQLFKLNLNDYI